MTTRAEFVRVVKCYVGTPYRHLGRLPGIALDCAGVPICAMAACGLPVPGPMCYSTQPTVGELETWLRSYAVQRPVEDREPGDVLAMSFHVKLGHCGVVTGPDRMVQARAKKTGGGKVRESRIGRGYDVRSCWALRGMI